MAPALRLCLVSALTPLQYLFMQVGSLVVIEALQAEQYRWETLAACGCRCQASFGASAAQPRSASLGAALALVLRISLASRTFRHSSCKKGISQAWLGVKWRSG